MLGGVDGAATHLVGVLVHVTRAFDLVDRAETAFRYLDPILLKSK
jgi:hypothetical protein